jgi:glycosyltransferase involved in cell wall biosynthesis
MSNTRPSARSQQHDVTAPAQVEPTLVSVVIPAHNAAGTIAEQLDALRPQEADGLPSEIVVVDNASSDDTATVVLQCAQHDPRIRLVRAPAGRGPSYARNIGVAAARGELIVCCDADDVVGVDWLPTMVKALREHLYVGGPLEVNRLNPMWLADARGHWGTNAPGRFGNVNFAHGCNLGIHRDALRAVGGFDERLRAGEEIDLALRLASRDIELYFVPDALVHYRYRDGLFANCKQSFGFGRVAPVLERRGRDLTDFEAEGASLRRTLWLAPNVLRLASRSGRVRWVWVASNLVGRTAGRWYYARV